MDRNQILEYINTDNVGALSQILQQQPPQMSSREMSELLRELRKAYKRTNDFTFLFVGRYIWEQSIHRNSADQYVCNAIGWIFYDLCFKQNITIDQRLTICDFILSITQQQQYSPFERCIIKIIDVLYSEPQVNNEKILFYLNKLKPDLLSSIPRLDCLDNAHAEYIYSEMKRTLQMKSPAMTEEAWLQVVNVLGRGRTEYISTWKEFLGVEKLDLYISGVVRQLNRLNLKTTGSCDGHGQSRPAEISLYKDDDVDFVLLENLLALELPRIRRHNRGNWITFTLGQRSVVHLNLAETLSKIRIEWLELGIDYIKQQLFNATLEELLMIPGASRAEGHIRSEVMNKLSPYVDRMTVDHYGNILAEKTYRTGNGPTVLLNAHLDVVEELIKGREIIKDNGIWSSSEGILGADDRAGVAVILEVAKTLQQDTEFSGTVKYIFTVEEEIGLVGARNVAEYFLWDVDVAMVIDRRGIVDIVTSCGGAISFCDDAYGEWIEQQAIEAGLDSWRCTAGGSSDTRIWAQQDIQSVNLSAGYYYEHTEAEILDVNACYNTVKLVKMVLKNGHSLRSLLRTIRIEPVPADIFHNAQSNTK